MSFLLLLVGHGAVLLRDSCWSIPQSFSEGIFSRRQKPGKGPGRGGRKLWVRRGSGCPTSSARACSARNADGFSPGGLILPQLEGWGEPRRSARTWGSLCCLSIRLSIHPSVRLCRSLRSACGGERPVRHRGDLLGVPVPPAATQTRRMGAAELPVPSQNPPG